MGKLDTSTIEGFDGMSAEQKVEALLGLDVPDAVDLSEFVPKAERDRACSQAAELRKQLEAKKKAEDATKSASDMAIKELQDKYDALVKESTIDKFTAQYRAMPGFTDELARSTAEAMQAGDMQTVIANQKKANEEYAKQMKAEAMRSMTPPTGGSAANPESDAMSIAKKLGQQKAASTKASEDILSHYRLK